MDRINQVFDAVSHLIRCVDEKDWKYHRAVIGANRPPMDKPGKFVPNEKQKITVVHRKKRIRN